MSNQSFDEECNCDQALELKYVLESALAELKDVNNKLDEMKERLKSGNQGRDEQYCLNCMTTLKYCTC